MPKINKLLKEKIEATIELMQGILEDTSVPKNIRRAIEEAKNKISDEKDLAVNISNAIYLMQDISNDINMPVHTRTEIWQIISELEGIREQCKC